MGMTKRMLDVYRINSSIWVEGRLRPQRCEIAVCLTQEQGTQAVLREGDRVWTKRLYTSHVSGTWYEEKFGHYSGTMRESTECRILRTKKRHKCQDCGKILEKGELAGNPLCHAYTWAREHHCLDCLTTVKPERVFTPDPDSPEDRRGWY